MGLSALLTLVWNLIAAFAEVQDRRGGSSPRRRPAPLPCTLPPRSIDAIISLMSDDLRTSVPTAGALHFPIHLAPAEAPQPEVFAEARAAATALVDCFSTGEALRGLSGLTDDYLGRIVDHDGEAGIRSALEVLSIWPARRGSLSPIGTIVAGQLPSNRVVLRRRFRPFLPVAGAPSNEYAFFFAKQGNRWFLDDFGFVVDKLDRSSAEILESC